jgi:hypothetical protein
MLLSKLCEFGLIVLPVLPPCAVSLAIAHEKFKALAGGDLTAI